MSNVGPKMLFAMFVLLGFLAAGSLSFFIKFIVRLKTGITPHPFDRGKYLNRFWHYFFLFIHLILAILFLYFVILGIKYFK